MLKFDTDDTFVAIRFPKAKDFFLMTPKDDILHFDINDMFSKQGFVFYPFDESGENAPPLFIEAKKIFINKRFSFYPETKDFTYAMTFDEYMDKARLFINATKDKFRKLVLSRMKNIESGVLDLYYIFEKAAKKYPGAFVYLFHHPVAGTWMGATPEILLYKNSERYETVALAGTQFVKNPEDITWTPKEREEHNAVKDFIENVLRRHNINFLTSKTGATTAAKNKNGYLVHLCTKYSFSGVENKGKLLLDLHPTPAVSGFPQREAVEFIKEHEGYDREYYTGFAGTVNISGNDNFNIHVNLRTMKIYQNKYRLYLGGGVNSQSIPEREWEETENKAKTMEELLVY